MLAAITCFFNPCNWQNRIDNLKLFRDKFTGCDLFIVEASFDDTFIFEDSLHIHANESNRYIWQKERMLNHLEQTLPAKYDKIAWIDADIVFDNKQWAEETEEKLDTYAVVQLFETVMNLDKDFACRQRYTSCGKAVSTDTSRYHCGFAWASIRNLFPLLELDIVGGADAIMLEWWFNTSNSVITRLRPERVIEATKEQKQRHFEIVNENVSYVSGNIRHLYHGTRQNRQYQRRHQKFKRLDFIPSRDLRIGSNGLFEWTDSKEAIKIKKWFHNYLTSRKEDS